MINLIGLSGSLRRASLNTALLRALAQVAAEDVALDVRTIHGIPLYDGDREAAEGLPTAVVQLKEWIAAADGLILATPEYNNSIPGPLKNAIDWLTRPTADIPRVFGGRPVALIGASPGGFGTILSQNAWLPILRYLGTHPWFDQRLMISRAGGLFDASGALTDEKTRAQLQQFINGFADFVRSRAGK